LVEAVELLVNDVAGSVNDCRLLFVVVVEEAAAEEVEVMELMKVVDEDAVELEETLFVGFLRRC